MAENALYISSVEHAKPTIFEVIAQESLMSTLQPSFTLLCKVLKIQSKDKLSWFFKFQEEWYLFINFLLQNHYLHLFQGSFSEAFYGLRRIPLKNKPSKLSTYSKIMSLFCLVGLPYITLKIRRNIESYQIQLPTDCASPEKKKKIRQILFTYKSMNILYEISRLYYMIGYMSGHLENHSPLLEICGVKLVYHNIQVPSWKELFTDYFKNKTRISTVILPITLKIFSQFIEISAFTVQFLNWWHSDEVKTKLNSLPVPPPLPVAVSNNKMSCPICNNLIRVEVVLQCSGYVYCYRCIKEELEKTGKCPVTNLPAGPEHLIRIYTDK